MMLYIILLILRSYPESAEEAETVTQTPGVCRCVILPSAGGALHHCNAFSTVKPINMKVVHLYFSFLS